jgi:site-specific DNA-cytosine methylase
MKLLELFKGTGSVGKVATPKGYEVLSLDFDKKFQPDIHTDILNWDYKKYHTETNYIPDFIWGSPPCQTFSPCVYRLKERNTKTAEPVSERAKIGTQILHKLLEIIEFFKTLNPNLLFCIENPVGMMRRDSKMLELHRESTYYNLYGDIKLKPTDFWSNFKTNIIPCKNNKKKCKDYILVQKLSKMKDKYAIPPTLIEQILTSADQIKNI